MTIPTLHPQVRSIFRKLSLPGPVQKYFSAPAAKIDLSNNTNPHLGTEAAYPDLGQEVLKKRYLENILPLNAPSGGVKPDLDPENVLFTVGSIEGIDLLIRTFCEPHEDTVCVLEPSFPAYEHWALIHGIKVEKVALSGDQFSSFSIAEILKINPKITFLCNPNNPTGTCLDPQLIRSLCSQSHGFVVIDEAYIEFSDDPSSLVLLKEFSNLIILRTLSKAWGMAGVRCGAVIAHLLLIDTLRYIQVPFGFPTLSQEKALEVFTHPEKVYASWKTVKKDRLYLTEELRSLNPVLNIFDSQTNFILVVFRDLKQVLEHLAKHEISVQNCDDAVPGAARITIGTREEIDSLLSSLKELEHRRVSYNLVSETA